MSNFVRANTADAILKGSRRAMVYPSLESTLLMPTRTGVHHGRNLGPDALPFQICSDVFHAEIRLAGSSELGRLAQEHPNKRDQRLSGY